MCCEHFKEGEVRQVVNPIIHIEVVDHVSMEIQCCRHNNKKLRGNHPKEAKGHVQYGDAFKALWVMLSNIGCMSYERIQLMTEALFNVRPSQGTLVNAVKSFAALITPTLDEMRKRLTQETLIHVDETGIDVNGKNYWIHVVSTPSYSYQYVHKKRGIEAMEAGGILPYYKNIAVHDFWKSYFHFDACTHAMCGAHLERELVYMGQLYPEQTWHKALLKWFRNALHTKHELQEKGETALPDALWEKLENQYFAILEHGFYENAEREKVPGVKKKLPRGKALPLLERLSDYKKPICRFLTDFSVPYTNNAAESDVRVTKIKLKVVGCFRSIKGAEVYAKTISYIKTAIKAGLNPFQAICEAYKGNPACVLGT